MKDTIAYRIRKLRESKDYSQENIAGELGISTSAYSKIERGVTDPSVGRMGQIAKILEVDINYFFQEQPAIINKTEDHFNPYGFATKIEVADINKAIDKLTLEIAGLKAKVSITPVKKKKKV